MSETRIVVPVDTLKFEALEKRVADLEKKLDEKTEMLERRIESTDRVAIAAFNAH